MESKRVCRTDERLEKGLENGAGKRAGRNQLDRPQLSSLALVIVLLASASLFACSNSDAEREDDSERVTGAAASDANVSETSLTDTVWKLIEIGGEPAGLGSGDREVHVIFGASNGSVTGFSGCNRFHGSFEAEGNAIHMSPLASTRMACGEGGDLEMRFLNALGGMDRFEIEGNSLSAYTGDLNSMRFEAGDPP